MTALESWSRLAACRDVVTAGYDPFFKTSEQAEREALAVCRICPVRAECLAYAVRTGQEYGVWGGTPQRELRRLIDQDRRGRTRAADHPSRHFNASKTHCKHGHPFDEDNTYYAPDGQRRCRTCLRKAQHAAAKRHRRRQAKTARGSRKAGGRNA